VLLFFFAPASAFGVWLERRIAERARAAAVAPGRRAVSFGGLARSLAAGIFGWRHGRFPLSWPAALALVAASAVFVMMPLGQYLVAADFDIGILFALAQTALVVVALLTGGASGAPWSVLRGLGAGARAVASAIPAAIAIACVVLSTGSIRLHEIIRAQGGLPWEWHLFRSPIGVFVFLVYFASVFPGVVAPTRLSEADDEPPRAAPDTKGARGPGTGRALGPRARWLFAFAEWAHLFVMCGMAAALFLGGWQLPGIAPSDAEAQPAWLALGGALFLAKSWLLAVLVASGRALLPRLPAPRFALTGPLPLAIIAFGATAAWSAWGPGPSAERTWAHATFAIALLALGRVVLRLRHAVLTNEPHLNPFV
jgi:NADH-quinone oxidoreductase subunit H